MPKYAAKPVEVDGYQILEVRKDRSDLDHAERWSVRLEDGTRKTLTYGQVARYTPQKGDYLVIQSDGYEYINPKAVFERKYRCIERAGFAEDAPGTVAEYLEELAQQVRAGELEVTPDEAVVVFNELDRGYLVNYQGSLGVTDVVTALAAGQQVMLNTLMPFGNEIHPSETE